ncbi:PorP/SprF family type IX secretion system membrane protein [Thermoflavifilum thermophilum]|uniref:Type IX secretion system membrane protein, PorP/SprF family n=1 Tax=Thermoflavifilum thermophilum TaxID=1393122 RepID=A0A1I7NIT5_9BACT|nr:PorP/SprF family type IX secretion system membrane protein [Thermoflavifilum thermophilum]SFV34558.1 type IX secretion system membrane protein, PorP/SprF family [Thermoflavifilum thermophilum]
MNKFIQKLKKLIFYMICLYQLPAWGQMNYSNTIAEYFHNQYLWNPALAGSKQAQLYGLFDNVWLGFDGSSKFVEFSFDMPFTEKMGAGIILNSFSSGLFDQYRGALSYAYQISWDDNKKIRLGGNLSFYKAHLNVKDLSNNAQIDPVITEFNNKGMQLDGDLGAYLQFNAFSIGLSGYNLSNYFKKSEQQESDWEMSQVQLSYYFPIQENKFSLQPLIGYQMFHTTKNILITAMQFTYQNVFNTSLYWKSTGCIMGGLGLILNSNLEINIFYSSKNKYGYQEQYEAGIKYMLNP